MEAVQKREGAIRLHPSYTNNRFTGESYTTFQRYNNYVPLDYFKATIINFEIQKLVNSELLNFAQLINPKTGEILQLTGKDGKPKSRVLTAKYKNLRFDYYPDSERLTISGSLHVFYNNGEHNHNDFDLNAFYCVLNDFYRLFDILPHNLHITQLEWGVNILPPIRSNDLINHTLLHGRNPFESKYNNYEGKYNQVEYHKRYLIKLYNKGLNYKLNHEILRFERKQLRYWFYCKENKIGQTLQDLIQSDFVGLRKTLLNDWNDLLIFDPLMNPNKTNVFKYRDVLFWNQSNFKDRFVRKYHVDKLRQANKKHGQNIQGQILDLIKRKLDELNSENLTLYPFNYMGKPLDQNNYNTGITSLEYPILSTHYFNGVFRQVL